jgi:gluconate 5-dehydrogenase
MFDLTDRVAIVTGGAGFLGRTIAETLGELGASVVIADRRGDVCEQAARELRAGGVDCTGAECDCTVAEQIDGLVDETVMKRERLDVMVCCAGGSRTAPGTAQGSLRDFRETYERNVTATHLSVQAAARAMVPRRSGSIITVGSIHGTVTSDPRNYENTSYVRSGPGYFASKGAVISITRCFAADFGPYGITVNCLSPGYIPHEGTDEQMVETWRSRNALRRTGVREDIKGAIALLASPAGRWITGHNLVVDGGWTIW